MALTPAGTVAALETAEAALANPQDGAAGAAMRHSPPHAARNRPVRIGLDVCSLTGSRTGIANYIETLLAPLCEQQPDATFVLYSNGDGDFPTAANIVHRISRPVRRGPIWHNTQLVRMLQQDAIDVFWGTNGLIPLHGLGRTASVVTIHDLVHRYAPQTQLAAVRWKQRVFQPLCARTADRLVAVSRATADDAAVHYGREPDAVIAPVARPAFGPVDPAAADATLARLGVSTPYLLTVGTLEPRKNILALVEAYAACGAAGAALPPLVLAGGRGWSDARLRTLLAQPALAGRIRALGFVPTESLVHLYARCHAFLMPSLYEGYGIPLLEAQLCRAPVVHGEHRSMVEAAGGVGVAVSPSPEGLRRALWDLAGGRLPLVSRLPATIDNDAADAAGRLWRLMTDAWQAKLRRLARQLA